ncbi:protein arginine kinase|uniref:Protein-arginine kinase n=1 Tax=Dendrosporobacter quercicolus TaxID=146817 RepID=A0A1G9V200_9FIRM|nr:protein arginine kinase [Dendrosporobacter quercicolus]NSL47948.1 protein arginine kinase [Dendrosporobacter quercicolus DSM 1736]SDM66252.1 protein arginine kinase [Dendrosporobacter quercicolus]
MAYEYLLDQPLTPWMNHPGKDGDVVLSSRIRLARNICELPFPNKAEAAQLSKVEDKLEGLTEDLMADTGDDYLFIALDKLTSLERNVLVEKHIISPNHAAQPENRALLVSNDATVSVMVNEEDHLRIQCMFPGLNLGDALVLAHKIDDTLEARLDIAFNEQLGYLTACPTNLGTGLRASVMMHLPGLVFTRQITRIVNAATQLGLAVRGFYGEGTEAAGNIFQISNQITLGFSEQEIIDNLTSAVRQILNHERSARQALYKHSPVALTDKVWRAYGLLKYARSMSGQEALSLLSELRLGVDLNIIDAIRPALFNELVVTTRPNYLQKIIGNDDLNQSELNRFRAQLIRETLEAMDQDNAKGVV